MDLKRELTDKAFELDISKRLKLSKRIKPREKGLELKDMRVGRTVLIHNKCYVIIDEYHYNTEDGSSWTEFQIQSPFDSNKRYLTYSIDDEEELSITEEKLTPADFGLKRSEFMDYLEDTEMLEYNGTKYYWDWDDVATLSRENRKDEEVYTIELSNSDDESISLSVENWDDGSIEIHVISILEPDYVEVFS